MNALLWLLVQQREAPDPALVKKRQAGFSEGCRSSNSGEAGAETSGAECMMHLPPPSLCNPEASYQGLVLFVEQLSVLMLLLFPSKGRQPSVLYFQVLHLTTEQAKCSS
ncbi:hypothetical protein KIL84_016128 [Mauremys mutica]|uniref:Uncharacterized protein n=1 Tax=Mauremys mutica TaxID=74926 RepID=A0A9D3WS44_9SAUR|nr:hypothetical protein KIL84_016128 [Mauremys mutica]